MVTHNLEHALRIGDRTIMMHEGPHRARPVRPRAREDDSARSAGRVYPGAGDQLVDDRLLLA